MRRRAVVTGVGVVAPNGIGKCAFWKAIISGKSGVGRVTRFNTDPYPTKLAAEVDSFDPTDWMDPKDISRTDRSTHFAVACAKMAAEDAGLSITEDNARRTGVAMGTAMGSLDFILGQHSIKEKEGPLKVNPFTTTAGSPNVCSAQVSLELRSEGPSKTFSTTCASSFDAVGAGVGLIREGKVDVMIVGGTDAPLAPFIFDAFCLSRIMSTRNRDPPGTPRPFDKDRDGIILGEGAGVLILEELEYALKRGAHIYAEIIGYATTCDAYHIVKPDPSGKNAVRAIKLALKDAKIEAEDVDCIHVHGSATVAGDRIETRIIRHALGKHSMMIPVICIKSMVGHTQGADGALELIACNLALEHNRLPPIINLEYPDPDCSLDFVCGGTREVDIDTILLNCIAFGGKNAALIIRRYAE